MLNLKIRVVREQLLLILVNKERVVLKKGRKRVSEAKKLLLELTAIVSSSAALQVAAQV